MSRNGQKADQFVYIMKILMRVGKRLRTVIEVLLIAAVVFFGALSIYVPHYVRTRAATALRQRFDSSVQFHGLRVSIFPRIKISGDGLILRKNGSKLAEPLIRIGKFSAASNLLDLVRKPHHVEMVRLQGLEITLPPSESEEPSPHRKHHFFPVVVERIIATDAALILMPKDKRKSPRVFVIHHLVLRNAGQGRAMPFSATLMNPKPVGKIEAQGEFGPWPNQHPGLTPVNGEYTFKNANLATIHGLGGILSSNGKFDGVLERIEVNGETATPDFSLSFSRHPESLKTTFHAIVDGATGDTLLHPVQAVLGKSAFIVKGGVFKTMGEKGRTVILHADVSNAHLEDLLSLAMKSAQPPMSGLASFDVQIKIPPGKEDITNRLALDGTFAVKTAHFTKASVQSKVNSLSRRGRGEPKNRDIADVVSNMHGRFALRNGIMDFRNLEFSVRGASVKLRGNYNLNTQVLDFKGALRLKAEISKATTGWKSFLLTPFNGFFKKGKFGTSLPIKVTGTESKPSFGVDVGRALTRRSE